MPPKKKPTLGSKREKSMTFMIGRGIDCTCGDCPVLYGGECLTGKTPKQQFITKKIKIPCKKK